MTRRVSRTAVAVTALVVGGIGAGIVSGAYTIPAPQASSTLDTAPHALPCSSFTAGAAPSGDYIGGVCYQDTTYDGYPTVDTVQYGTDLPRCASDDWNSTHLPRCYVEGPGTVIIIGQDDTTLATLR